VSFRRFAESVCKVEPSPLIAAVMDASEGRRPTTITQAACVQHFGCKLAELPDEPRRTVAVRSGGRAGKTSRLVATKALHAAWTVPVPGLRRGEAAYSLLVAPDLMLARQAFSFVLGYVEDSPTLSRAVIGKPTKNWVELRRPDGVRVRIEVAAASRGGRGTRGRTLVFAALDEAAFFFDETTGVVNDADVWRAVLQRVVPGGQVWITSTPWIEDLGLLEEQIGKNFGVHDTALAVTGGTRDFNPSWDPTGEIERDLREQDPDAATREVDGLPIGGGAGQFLDPVAIKECVDLDLSLPMPVVRGTAYFGADLAFSSDSSALVGVANVEGLHTVVVADELRPKKGAPLRPKHVIDTFAGVLGSYGCKRFLADQHYRESAREHLQPHGISFVDAPAGDQRGESYLHLRKMIHEHRVRLPSHPRLLAQLRSIIAKPMAQERWSYMIPRRRGQGHGDLVSALILALWAVRGGAQSDEKRAAVRAAARRCTDRAPPVGAEFAMVQEGAWNEAHRAPQRTVPRRDPADYDVATRSWKRH
jgi:hypothetical protein